MGKKRGILLAALVLVALVILVWFLAAKPGHGSRNASIDSNTSEESQITATNEGPTTDNEPVVSVSTQAQQGEVSALSAPTNQMAAVALVAAATNDAASTTAVLTASTKHLLGATNGAGPLKIELVRIEPGTFTMGSPQTEWGRKPQEGPQTVVTLTRAFWMGKYEVTVDQYEDVLGAGAAVPDDNMGMYVNKKGRDRPVMRLSWADATNFCAQLTEREREAGRLPEGYVYRLPTEAEWQYACRAGTTTRYFFGDDLGGVLLGEYAWYRANSDGTVHRVGEKKPNLWGLYDMEGNASEWCLDVYRLPGGEVTDPVGTMSGPWRVLAGGSWCRGPDDQRSASRHAGNPVRAVIDAGFRIALAPELP